MKELIFILICLSFLQSSLVDLDLVAAFLIVRSFTSNKQSNMYLAFGFGLLIASLTGGILGQSSLVYLIFVLIAQFIKVLPVHTNWLTIVPLSLGLFLLQQIFIYLIYGVSIEPKTVLIHSFLVLAIYVLLKFWDERFVAKEQLKIKR